MANPIQYEIRKVLGTKPYQILGSANTIYAYEAVNPNSVPVYLKFYDKLAVNVNPATDVPSTVLTIPAAIDSNPGILASSSASIAFSTAISVRCTTVNLSQDTSAPAISPNLDIQVDQVSGGGGGATIPSTTNLIAGDGAGNGADSKLAVAGPTVTRTMTVPDANFTAARTDAANTFTGHQTIEGVTSTGATGTGKFVFDTSPALVTPALGTPASGTLTSCTGLPVSTGVSGLGTGVAAFLATPSSANFAAAMTDETGSGSNVFATSPTLVTPILGTPTSGTLTNCTGLPVSTGVSGLGSNVAAFLATPSSANFAAAMTDETGTGANVFGTTPTLTAPVLAAGTTGAPSINFTAGTLKTTTAAGDVEMDANCFYGSTAASGRGYISNRMMLYAGATVTQSSDTNPHAIFTTPTNGRITLPTGAYRFCGLMSWSSMSATSGNLKVDILGAGTATAANWMWCTLGFDALAGSTPGNFAGAWQQTSASSANAVGGTVATSTIVKVEGTVQVTVAGTLIPTQTLGTAAAAVLSIGSYIEFWRIGSTGVTSIGPWD